MRKLLNTNEESVKNMASIRLSLFYLKYEIFDSGLVLINLSCKMIINVFRNNLSVQWKRNAVNFSHALSIRSTNNYIFFIYFIIIGTVIKYIKLQSRS